MASTDARNQERWAGGRAFASPDPERQREVTGYVRSGPIATVPTQTFGVSTRASQGWTRMQWDRDSASFEGSSSRRGR